MKLIKPNLGLIRKVQRLPHFNPWLAVLVAFTFGVVGSYLLFSSHAAVTSVVVEAETFTLPSGGSIVYDGTARGGQAVLLKANGTATGTVSFTSPVTSISVRAKGGLCKGSPQFTVSIDDKVVMTTQASSNSWADYGSAASVTAGAHTIKVTFTNDYVYKHPKKACDRDLYIDTVSFVEQMPDTNNQAPVAKITPSFSSEAGKLVDIYAATSYDPDGDPISFAWKQISGPVVTFTTVDPSHIRFTPMQAGDYVIRVTVTDSKGASSSKDTTVAVTPPTNTNTSIKGEVSTGTVEPRLLTDPNVLWVGTFDHTSWRDLWGFGTFNNEINTTVNTFTGVTDQGKAMRGVNPAAKQFGFGGNASFVNMGEGSSAGVTEQEAVYFRYRVYFPSDYVWTNPNGGGHGKLPGLAGKATGGADWAVSGGGKRWNGTTMINRLADLSNADGWSARLLWQKDKGASVYLYAPNKYGVVSGTEGTDSFRAFGKSVRLKTDPYNSSSSNMLFNTGWNTVEQYVKMNTPGVANGELKVWMNGKLGLQMNDVMYRGSQRTNLKATQLFWTWFYGGPTNDYPHINSYIYFDDAVLSKSYIGPRQ